MTAMENLGDNQGLETTLPESLTDQEASDAIKFSPELAGGKMGREEYLRNLVSNVDMNKVKELITDSDFNLLDKKDVLMREYGFTEEEIMESERYLEEARANPDMIESDIETEMMPGLLTIAILCLVGGTLLVGASSCSDKPKERIYLEAGEYLPPVDVFKITTVEQQFYNVAGKAEITDDFKLLFVKFPDKVKSEVKLMIDGKISANFNGADILNRNNTKGRRDGYGNLTVDISIPRPDIMISDVTMHDVSIEENAGQKLSFRKKSNKEQLTEDAYNNAVKSVLKRKECSNDFYEKARQSLEVNVKNCIEFDLSHKKDVKYNSVTVNVRYTNDEGHIYYDGEEIVQQHPGNQNYTPPRKPGRR